MEPEWSSCLQTQVCWDFRSVPLAQLLSDFFTYIVFASFFPFFYLFSSLHNLHKYCNILMFFLDLTSITCSLSPLTYFWWECVPVCIFACSSVHVLVEVRGQLPLSVLSCLPPLCLRHAFLWPGALHIESVSITLGLRVCPAFWMGSGEMNSGPYACKVLYQLRHFCSSL